SDVCSSDLDQGIGRAQAFVVSGLVGQVGKVGAQVAHGVADPAVLGGEAEQGLGDGQGDQFGVGKPGPAAPACALWYHLVVDEDVERCQKGVQMLAHTTILDALLSCP